MDRYEQFVALNKYIVCLHFRAMELCLWSCYLNKYSFFLSVSPLLSLPLLSFLVAIMSASACQVSDVPRFFQLFLQGYVCRLNVVKCVCVWGGGGGGGGMGKSVYRECMWGCTCFVGVRLLEKPVQNSR